MSVAMEQWPRRHRISVEEYHRMAEVGLLAPDARVELIEGEIIEMPPIGSHHGSIVDRLNKLFVIAAGDRAIVRCQGPVRLGNYSEPQPDLSLLAPRADFYMENTPTNLATLLAIEVSESTFRFDRTRKMRLYARFGIPEFWIFDVSGRRLHTFRNPQGETYTEVAYTDDPGHMSVRALPELSVDLSEVIGSRTQ